MIARFRELVLLLTGLGLALALSVAPASALKPITVTTELERLEITNLGELYEGRGDLLQFETAPGADGTVNRMAVRATTPGTSPSWLVFALQNPTDKTIELWLTAERYSVVGSGVVWPDLDARRIEAVSHSSGFLPERVKSDRTDVFRLTIERGQTITYAAELSSERFARLNLAKPLEFEQRQRDRQLYNGIMLGIIGLLAVFLTAVFAANHKAIFPSAALVAWCVLALLCVDFGFWHKLFQMRPEDNAQYRAASEAAFAASLVIFLSTFLRVYLWNGFARTLVVVWIIGQLAVVAMAVLDPRLAATVARMSLAVIGVVGAITILAFAVRGIDRALALVPTWILYLVWLFGAGVTLTGRLTGEFAISGLVAGLVLIMVLIGFTVTQFAFKSSEPSYGANAGQQHLRFAAMERSGIAVWEWSARRDEIKLDPDMELTLGLNPGELPTKVEAFVEHLHPADKSRFLDAIAAIKDRTGGEMRLDLRLRHADSSYRWLELEGSTIPTSDRRQLRCVGIVRDVTDQRRAQERLLHDAVHDSLTGLPNRELFLDRLNVALERSKSSPGERPAVFVFDIDKFKSVNSSFGLIVGDSILLTVARRLGRNLAPMSTLARIGGDQFALTVVGQSDPRELALIADRLRLALRSPIRIAGQEIVLTSAIGIALDDGATKDGRDLLREAEVAMHRAKHAGSDRIEVFKPELRSEKDSRIAIESELRRAIEGRQLRLLYQPIVSLSTVELVGFEALVRWQHPRLGLLSPADFLPIAEESDLIVQLGSMVMAQAAEDVARWQKELPRPDQPLFVTVNISSRQLIKPDLVNEVRHVLQRAVISPDTLRLEITESLVMENPEQASHVLDLLKELGIRLALDDFGTGYSSFAYLNRFPFDTIKIDKALVQASANGGNGAIIVRSIVALAHELDRKIVGEGVEAPEDAAFLRSLGCQYAQGFHYGEPMPDSDVVRLLRLIRKADRRMRRRGLVRKAEKKKPADTAASAGGSPSQEAQPPSPQDAAPREAPPQAPAGAPPGQQNAPARPTPQVAPDAAPQAPWRGPPPAPDRAAAPLPHQQPPQAAAHQPSPPPRPPQPDFGHNPPMPVPARQMPPAYVPLPAMVTPPTAPPQAPRMEVPQSPAMPLLRPNVPPRASEPPQAVAQPVPPPRTLQPAQPIPAATLHPSGQPSPMPARAPRVEEQVQPPASAPAATGQRDPSPSPGPMGGEQVSTIDRVLGRVGRPAPDPAPPADTIPIVTAEDLAEPETPIAPVEQVQPNQPGGQSRRPQRRPTSERTLPPRIAERLARLAGKSPTSGAPPADVPAQPPGKTAAE